MNYNYGYNFDDIYGNAFRGIEGAGPILFAVFIAFLGISMIVGIFTAICMWKIFTKAGHPGWKSLIPVYNTYIMILIGGNPGWWLLLLFIPYVNIVISILMIEAFVRSFGRVGIGPVLLMMFLGIFYLPYLAFSKEVRYIGVRQAYGWQYGYGDSAQYSSGDGSPNGTQAQYGSQEQQQRAPRYAPQPGYQPVYQPVFQPGFQSGFQPDAQSGVQPGFQHAPQPGYQPGYQPGPQYAPQPGYQPGPQYAPQIGYQPGSQYAPQPGYQPGYQPGLQHAPQPGYQPGYQPGFQHAPQPGYQSGYQPGFRPGFQPDPQYDLQPGLRPGNQSGAQYVSQPDMRDTVRYESHGEIQSQEYLHAESPQEDLMQPGQQNMSPNAMIADAQQPIEYLPVHSVDESFAVNSGNDLARPPSN